jgi:Protein of unknown function (DUF3303)
MKFIIRYHITDQDKYLPATRKWASLSPEQRAKEPGEGITKIGHWADVSGRRGVVIVESNDLIAVGRWCGQWNPYLEAEITPVVDEGEITLISQHVVADTR